MPILKHSLANTEMNIKVVKHVVIRHQTLTQGMAVGIVSFTGKNLIADYEASDRWPLLGCGMHHESLKWKINGWQ